MAEDPNTEAFFDEVRNHGQVFGLADDKGFPAPLTAAGHRAMPFWSRRSRAERVRSTVPGYRPLQVVALPVEVWRERWLTGLAADGLRVGLNWAGPQATGHDLAPDDVARRLNQPGDQPGRLSQPGRPGGQGADQPDGEPGHRPGTQLGDQPSG